MRCLVAAACLVFSAMASVAGDWVSLGGGLEGYEIDMSSVREESIATKSATVRLSGMQEQGLLTIYFNYLAHCKYRVLEVTGGELHSTWSSRVETMPNLPESERFSRVPLPNQQLNNLYDYLCR